MQVRDLLRALSEKQNGMTIHAVSIAKKGGMIYGKGKARKGGKL